MWMKLNRQPRVSLFHKCLKAVLSLKLSRIVPLFEEHVLVFRLLHCGKATVVGILLHTFLAEQVKFYSAREIKLKL